MESAATNLGHQEAQALFAPMVDCEIAGEQEAALKSHLQACHDCQQGFEKYARAVALVRSVGHERAPADFAQQVLKRVRKRRRGVFGGAQIFNHISVPVQAGVLIVIALALSAAIFFWLH